MTLFIQTNTPSTQVSRRRVLIRVGGRLMEGLTRGRDGIHVDDRLGEMRHVMQEPMTHLGGDRVAFLHREIGVDGHVHFGMQPMPDPTRPHLGHLLDAWSVLGCMHNSADHLGTHTIEEPRQDRPTGLPHNCKIMYRVRKERDTPGQPDDDYLQQCGAQQSKEGSLNDPQATRGSHDGGIDYPMGMRVSMRGMLMHQRILHMS
jgi:hypothetical protein